ncbi:uncharacterized protein [Anabrus simplex]|uniref:uncharacterized protein n=1 Tax=Anabrus simplex TaxID=316456 RepID=UPI0034DD7F89
MKCLTVNKCCCGCSLRQGSIFTGVAFGVLSLLQTVGIGSVADHLAKENGGMNGDAAIFTGGTIVWACFTIANLLLIVGATQIWALYMISEYAPTVLGNTYCSTAVDSREKSETTALKIARNLDMITEANSGVVWNSCTISKGNRIIIMIYMAFICLLLFFDILLLIGLHLMNPTLVLMWVISHLIGLVLLTVDFVVLFGFYTSSGRFKEAFGVVIGYVFLTVITLYFLLVVYNFYRSLKCTCEGYEAKSSSSTSSSSDTSSEVNRKTRNKK